MTLPDALLIALYYAGVRISVGLGTLLLDLMILATALYFASRRGEVGPRELGIRRTSSRAAVGWVVLGLVSILVFSALYELALNPGPDRDPFRHAHAHGALAVSVLGLTAILVAPSVEELFFRGFIYRAFRNSLAAFDEVFRTEGVEIIRTPVKAPNANAHAERFIRTVRSDCLDWLLIFGRRQLERVLREYVDHYNRERPHRALELRAPEASPKVVPLRPPGQIAVRRRDRLGGLVHEYALAA